MTMVNDIPTLVDEALGGGISYQESVPVTTVIGVSGTGYDSAHIVFTLPNAKTYDGASLDELIVSRNGVVLTEGTDYNYENSASATTITMTVAQPKNSRIQFTI